MLEPMILTELLPYSLYDLLEVKKHDLDLPDVLDFSSDIINGLDYLHRHQPPIVHRDISSKNILIGDIKAKFAELGQAKVFGDTAISRQSGMPGAMAYAAPEVLTGKYSSKIDIFSFGVLLCQMSTGDYPRID
jgi:serine/threonine-protein kinase CTR1